MTSGEKAESTLWTPLPSANASCYRARSGLSPPSYRPCWAHRKDSQPERIYGLAVSTEQYYCGADGEILLKALPNFA